MKHGKPDLTKLTFVNTVSHSQEYHTWCGMKNRCMNPNNSHYDSYGGRGIKVCDEWMRSFNDFYNDIGPSNGMSLERIDVNGNYEPENCKWIPLDKQARNKTNNRRITAFGQEKIMSDWASELNISPSHVHYFLRKGQTIEQIAQGRIPKEKMCPACGAVFETTRYKQIFCDDTCTQRQRCDRRNKHRREQKQGMFIIVKFEQNNKLYARRYGKRENGQWKGFRWHNIPLMATKIFTRLEADAVALQLDGIAFVEKVYQES